MGRKQKHIIKSTVARAKESKTGRINKSKSYELNAGCSSINVDSNISSTFKCVLCNRIFSTHQDMVTHFQNLCKDKTPKTKDDNDSTIPCDWCTSSFDSLQAAMKHKWATHKYDAQNYNCQHCGTMFTFQIMLNRHIEKVHLEECITDDSVDCRICAMQFTNQSALDQHIKTVHLVHQIQCEGAFFVPGPSSQITINSAKETVSLYFCQWCGSSYILKYHLRNHLMDHHKDKINAPPEETIKCSICDAVFFCRKAFDVHNKHSVNDCFISSDKQRQMLNMKQELDYGPPLDWPILKIDVPESE